MEYQFLYIDTNESQDYNPFPFYINKCPNRFKNRAEQWYLWKFLPADREEIISLGAAGLKLRLPFTRKQLSDYSEERISFYLAGIIARESVQNIVVAPWIRKYMGEIEHREGRHLAIGFIEQILLDIRRRYRISKKDMALIILDEQDVDIPELLSEIKLDLNYLTIITERPEQYEEFCKELLEETGLLVQIQNKNEARYLNGNIILDFRTEADKFYRYFPNQAVVLELSGNLKKTKDILVKRKDLHIYNKIEVSVEAEEINPGVLEIIMEDEGRLPEISRNIRIICSLTLDG